MTLNLNRETIPTDGKHAQPPEDNGVYSPESTVIFRDLIYHLCLNIEKSDIVLGCVAWLTHSAVIDALSEKDGVGIIVQKEDFLRPDVLPKGESSWPTYLRSLYDQLPDTLYRNMFALENTMLYQMSYCNGDGIAPIRCMGIVDPKTELRPRMHNKFFVFCRKTIYWDDDCVEENENPEFMPYAVWTGSFNPTKNSESSLENAVILTDSAIVNAYFKEWAQITALSEKLDWTWEYVDPEWRIGS